MKPRSKEKLKVTIPSILLSLYNMVSLIEDQTNLFKNISEGADFSGLNLIIGGYNIHLLEAEGTVLNKILNNLN